MEKLLPNSRGRVLFADDDRAARESLTEVLCRLGFDGQSSANATQVLVATQFRSRKGRARLFGSATTV
jgi:FixJ family two-component response regulator